MEDEARVAVNLKLLLTTTNEFLKLFVYSEQVRMLDATHSAQHWSQFTKTKAGPSFSKLLTSGFLVDDI